MTSSNFIVRIGSNEGALANQIGHNFNDLDITLNLEELTRMSNDYFVTSQSSAKLHFNKGILSKDEPTPVHQTTDRVTNRVPFQSDED